VERAARGSPQATEHDGHPAVTLRLDGDVTEIVPTSVAGALERR